MNAMEWLLLLLLCILVLPVIVFGVARAGTMGVLMACERFKEFKKDKEEEDGPIV